MTAQSSNTSPLGLFSLPNANTPSQGASIGGENPAVPTQTSSSQAQEFTNLFSSAFSRFTAQDSISQPEQNQDQEKISVPNSAELHIEILSKDNSSEVYQPTNVTLKNERGNVVESFDQKSFDNGFKESVTTNVTLPFVHKENSEYSPITLNTKQLKNNPQNENSTAGNAPSVEFALLQKLATPSLTIDRSIPANKSSVPVSEAEKYRGQIIDRIEVLPNSQNGAEKLSSIDKPADTRPLASSELLQDEKAAQINQKISTGEILIAENSGKIVLQLPEFHDNISDEEIQELVKKALVQLERQQTPTPQFRASVDSTFLASSSDVKPQTSSGKNVIVDSQRNIISYTQTDRQQENQTDRLSLSQAVRPSLPSAFTGQNAEKTKQLRENEIDSDVVVSAQDSIGTLNSQSDTLKEMVKIPISLQRTAENNGRKVENKKDDSTNQQQSQDTIQIVGHIRQENGVHILHFSAQEKSQVQVNSQNLSIVHEQNQAQLDQEELRTSEATSSETILNNSDNTQKLTVVNDELVPQFEKIPQKVNEKKSEEVLSPIPVKTSHLAIEKAFDGTSETETKNLEKNKVEISQQSRTNGIEVFPQNASHVTKFDSQNLQPKVDVAGREELHEHKASTENSGKSNQSESEEILQENPLPASAHNIASQIAQQNSDLIAQQAFVVENTLRDTTVQNTLRQTVKTLENSNQEPPILSKSLLSKSTENHAIATQPDGRSVPSPSATTLTALDSQKQEISKNNSEQIGATALVEVSTFDDKVQTTSRENIQPALSPFARTISQLTATIQAAHNLGVHVKDLTIILPKSAQKAIQEVLQPESIKSVSQEINTISIPLNRTTSTEELVLQPFGNDQKNNVVGNEKTKNLQAAVSINDVRQTLPSTINTPESEFQVATSEVNVVPNSSDIQGELRTELTQNPELKSAGNVLQKNQSTPENTTQVDSFEEDRSLEVHSKSTSKDENNFVPKMASKANVERFANAEHQVSDGLSRAELGKPQSTFTKPVLSESEVTESIPKEMPREALQTQSIASQQDSSSLALASKPEDRANLSRKQSEEIPVSKYTNSVVNSNHADSELAAHVANNKLSTKEEPISKNREIKPEAQIQRTSPDNVSQPKQIVGSDSAKPQNNRESAPIGVSVADVITQEIQYTEPIRTARQTELRASSSETDHKVQDQHEQLQKRMQIGAHNTLSTSRNKSTSDTPISKKDLDIKTSYIHSEQATVGTSQPEIAQAVKAILHTDAPQYDTNTPEDIHRDIQILSAQEQNPVEVQSSEIAQTEFEPHEQVEGKQQAKQLGKSDAFTSSPDGDMLRISDMARQEFSQKSTTQTSKAITETVIPVSISAEEFTSEMYEPLVVANSELIPETSSIGHITDVVNDEFNEIPNLPATTNQEVQLDDKTIANEQRESEVQVNNQVKVEKQNPNQAQKSILPESNPVDDKTIANVQRESEVQVNNQVKVEKQNPNQVQKSIPAESNPVSFVSGTFSLQSDNVDYNGQLGQKEGRLSQDVQPLEPTSFTSITPENIEVQSKAVQENFSENTLQNETKNSLPKAEDVSVSSSKQTTVTSATDTLISELTTKASSQVSRNIVSQNQEIPNNLESFPDVAITNSKSHEENSTQAEANDKAEYNVYEQKNGSKTQLNRETSSSISQQETGQTRDVSFENSSAKSTRKGLSLFTGLRELQPIQKQNLPARYSSADARQDNSSDSFLAFNTSAENTLPSRVEATLRDIQRIQQRVFAGDQKFTLDGNNLPRQEEIQSSNNLPETTPVPTLMNARKISQVVEQTRAYSSPKENALTNNSEISLSETSNILSETKTNSFENSHENSRENSHQSSQENVRENRVQLSPRTTAHQVPDFASEVVQSPRLVEDVEPLQEPMQKSESTIAQPLKNTLSEFSRGTSTEQTLPPSVDNETQSHSVEVEFNHHDETSRPAIASSSILRDDLQRNQEAENVNSRTQPLAQRTQATKSISPLASKSTGQKTSSSSERNNQEVSSPLPSFSQTVATSTQPMKFIAEQVVRSYTNVAPQAIPGTIAQAYRTFPDNEGGIVKMTLNPDDLGQVHVNIAVSNGSAQIMIQAESKEVKQLIEHQIQSLIDRLSEQGVKVESVSVSAQSGGEMSSDSRQNESKNSDTKSSVSQNSLNASTNGDGQFSGRFSEEERRNREEYLQSFRALAEPEIREELQIQSEFYKELQTR